MTPEEHREQAERRLELAAGYPPHSTARLGLLGEANVHAILALLPAPPARPAPPRRKASTSKETPQ